jgi:hypothetical protein
MSSVADATTVADGERYPWASAIGSGGGGIWIKMRINLNNVGKTIISHPPNHHK